MKLAPILLLLLASLHAQAEECVPDTDAASVSSQRKIDAEEALILEEENTKEFLNPHLNKFNNCKLRKSKNVVDLGFGVAHACVGVRWQCTNGPNCRVRLVYDCDDGKSVSFSGKKKLGDGPVDWSDATPSN